MQILAIAMAFWWLCSSQPSLSLLEKQALTAAQRVSVTKLDEELPASSFAVWFRRLVGSQAGVVWQLSECGEAAGASPQRDTDIKACVEANALMPDNRKVIVRLRVGTFKKGIIGDPEFYFAVIEERGDLLQIRQLHELQERLHPTAHPYRIKRSGIPVIPMANPARHLALFNNQVAWRLPEIHTDYKPGSAASGAIPPPPPNLKLAAKPLPKPSPASPAKPPVAAGTVLQGTAVIKVQPRYPANAKRVNAAGTVEVQILISETGVVMEAKAISGHPLLREAAIEAAFKWVFKPTTANGAPVKTSMVLSFFFTVP